MGALSESGQNSGSSVYQWPRGKWIMREKTIQSLCLFWIPLCGAGHNAGRLLGKVAVCPLCVSRSFHRPLFHLFYALRLSSVFDCASYRCFYYCTSLILFSVVFNYAFLNFFHFYLLLINIRVIKVWGWLKRRKNLLFGTSQSCHSGRGFKDGHMRGTLLVVKWLRLPEQRPDFSPWSGN